MSNKPLKKRPSKYHKKSADLQAILVQASQAHSAGRLAEAEHGYLQVLKSKPGWGQVINALGTVYLDLSEFDKARSCFEKASTLVPPELSACYNLARLQQRDGDHEQALILYQKILEVQPERGEVWNNLGLANRETGNQDQAFSCFQNAVNFAPDMAEAWNNLGVALDENNSVEEAITAYRRAVAIDPAYPSAHFNLGSALQKQKNFTEAAEHYQKVLELAPDHKPARFMLQSLGDAGEIPEMAPVEHVRRIFDQCAKNFEKTLVKDLEYKTPELLFNLVQPHLTPAMNVLDLGCGTGLGAGLYRPFAKTLSGVDVSPKMLDKAAEKNVYDTLEAFDILQEWVFPHTFDLIYSSDVFVYFGKLERIIGAISAQLERGGIVAFSVENWMTPTKTFGSMPAAAIPTRDNTYNAAWPNMNCSYWNRPRPRSENSPE